MIAILGTGTMGAPMARNLHAAGLEVRAWNRTPGATEPLAEDGIEVPGSAEEAVHGADLVLTVLSDGDAVTEVLEDGGALAAMADAAVLVQMSTVGIAATEAVAALAEDRGIALVDAPVLGTKAPAEKGELIVLASGPPDAVERCRPVFEAVGSKTVELGDAGGGTRMKLVLNNWLLSLTAALAESVALAEQLDLDPSLFLDVIRDGPLGLPYADLKGKAMIKRSFDPSFAASLAAKDAGLVLEAAVRKELKLLLAQAAASRYRATTDAGHGDLDMAAVLLAVTKEAPPS